MQRGLSLLAMAAVLSAAPAFGQGYRIPEQSMNAVALSAAYVANTWGADTSYYNPANMAWLDNRWQMEANVTYINLPSIDYTDATTPTRNGSSKTEEFVLPNLHVVSPDFNNFRFGFSVVYPAGLSKRWSDTYPRTFAEDFTLKSYEFNPTVSYKVNSWLSVGMGLRAIYSEGEVRSYGTVAPASLGGSEYTTIRRDLEGDTTEYGYNLAITAKPDQHWTFAATYRSKIDLDLDGSANLWSTQTFPGGLVAAGSYNGYAEVSIPLPAVLSLATSYAFERTTVEFVYEKNYWNAYDKLDFNYRGLSHPILVGYFDNPVAKNWTNASAYRFGLTHRCTDRLTAMLGFAIDQNPVPDSTLGFELPDSDAKLYSLGFRYQQSDRLDLGIAYLYDVKEKRTVANGSVNGTFRDASAHLLSLGAQYRF